MLHRASATGRAPLHLLYGTPAHGLLIYGDELDGLAASYDRFGWEAVPTADLEAVVEDRYVTGDAGRDRHFYVCGVGDRVRRLRRLLRGAGYARRAVLCERW
jgi:ferredoxin-NADP reductase